MRTQTKQMLCLLTVMILVFIVNLLCIKNFDDNCTEELTEQEQIESAIKHKDTAGLADVWVWDNFVQTIERVIAWAYPSYTYIQLPKNLTNRWVQQERVRIYILDCTLRT